ncbi:uncharacterized protein LOC113212054 [Frankliniella occidentalis]|uniref:Uncharacterized protein LOC113212054 n=1 Tax=Frankliniella occidentalis TaxID=133901 RepID=A0A6J1T467_FRAOC|nr:uncharacterized protein LOC113212054 [Frankliniella occidentalis]
MDAGGTDVEFCRGGEDMPSCDAAASCFSWLDSEEQSDLFGPGAATAAVAAAITPVSSDTDEDAIAALLSCLETAEERAMPSPDATDFLSWLDSEEESDLLGPSATTAAATTTPLSSDTDEDADDSGFSSGHSRSHSESSDGAAADPVDPWNVRTVYPSTTCAALSPWANFNIWSPSTEDDELVKMASSVRWSSSKSSSTSSDDAEWGIFDSWEPMPNEEEAEVLRQLQIQEEAIIHARAALKREEKKNRYFQKVRSFKIRK